MSLSNCRWSRSATSSTRFSPTFAWARARGSTRLSPTSAISPARPMPWPSAPAAPIPDDSVAILGQAWYQAAIPCPSAASSPTRGRSWRSPSARWTSSVSSTRTPAAGDEAKQFLNSVFVHNPLLDAGGEVGVDANGFQPGFVAAYVNETNKAEPWRLSIGVFGAGDRGSNYQKSLSSPLLMVQAEKQFKLFGGLTGNYRAYAWTRSEVTDLDGVTSPASIPASASPSTSASATGSICLAATAKLIKGELPFNQAAHGRQRIQRQLLGPRGRRHRHRRQLAEGEQRLSGNWRQRRHRR
jgi:hypothetical protein